MATRQDESPSTGRGSSGFFAELKRRNVIRMAGLYLVGAWLVVQVASTMLPAFDAPSWVLRAVIIALAIGFIPVLVVSWVFELTPAGLKRDAEVPASESIAPQTARRLDRILLVVAILALGYFAFDKFVLAPRRDAALLTQVEQARSAVAKQANAAALAADPKSIAVLPFVNMSGDAKDEYFSDGITEEILHALAQVPDLKVAGRTSAFAFKGKAQDLRKVGEALGVAVVLEGSVQKAGDEVRITAQLVDVRSGYHLWSSKYDRKLTSIFAVEDEISRAIAAKLQAQLADGGLTRKPVDPRAHDFYLRGLTLIAARGPGLRDAVAAFRSAVEIAPDYAQAWGAMAQAEALYPSYDLGSMQEAYPRALTSAQRALALNPDTASALVAQGMVYSGRWQWAKADAAFARALALAPSDAEATCQYAQFLAATGNFEQALAEAERAQKLDPLAPVNGAWVGWSLYFLHRNDEAWAQFQRTAAAFPDYAPAQTVAAHFALIVQRWPDAERYARKTGRLLGLDAQKMAPWIDVIHGVADPALHASTAERLKTTPWGLHMRAASPYTYTRVLCLLDDCTAALPVLEQIAAQGEDAEPQIVWMPAFDPIREDPRFKAILAKMGLPYTPKAVASP